MLFKTPFLAFTFSTSFTRGNWSGLRTSRGHCFFKTASWVGKEHVSKWKHLWQCIKSKLCHFLGWRLDISFCIFLHPIFMLYDVGPRRHKQKQEMHQSGKELPESKAWKGFWKKQKRPILTMEFLRNPTKPTKRMESLWNFLMFLVSFFSRRHVVSLPLCFSLPLVQCPKSS